MPWLLAFDAAARHKSFGSAAIALGTSQPAISQRIANLEATLGVKLFKRMPRGVQLTPEGAVLLARLNEGLGLLESAILEMRQHRSDGHLTVATDFGFAAFWLVPRLPSLRRAAPELDVRVVTSQTEVDITREPIDVAIVFGSGQWPGCVAEPIVPEAVIPVCAPGLLDSRPAPTTPRDLQALPLLHLEAVEDTQWLDWSGWFQAVGVAFAASEHRVTINNYSLVIQAALAGQGVALGWRPLVDDLLDKGQLVPALDRTVVTDRGYYFVHRRAAASSKVVTLFRSWLQGELQG
jgi:putative choline sulfate-utilization transcription factor